MKPKNLTLFHYWRSSCSWRVRWALALKEIPYQTKPINLIKDEQKSDFYKQLNPSEQVPCLQVENTFISESLAIIEWLDEIYPYPKILPGDPLKRLQIRSLSYKIASGIQPIQNLCVMKKYHREKEKQLEWSKYWIEKGFKSIEKILEKTASPFCFGQQVTLADLCLIPQVYNAKRFSVVMTQFPKIEKIYDNCLTTKACQESHPDQFQ